MAPARPISRHSQVQPFSLAAHRWWLSRVAAPASGRRRVPVERAAPRLRRGAVTGHTRQRLTFIVTLSALFLACASVVAQQPPTALTPLRFSRNIPGDSKAIVLHADQITTWTDGGQRILLHTRKVVVEQGVVSRRTQQAVVWVDEERWRRTRIYHIDLYAEGAVQLENGPESKRGPAAVIDLNTRGEIRLRAQTSKVVQQTRF